MVIKKFTHRFEIGIILAIVGTQISKVITELFGNFGFDMTNLIFLLSLLLVADYKSILNFDLKISKAMFLILGYNQYALFAAIIADEGLFTQNQGIIYTLYVIAFLLLVATNQKGIDEEFLISAAWWIMGIETVLLMWVITSGFFNISSAGFIRTNGGSDQLTLSVLPFIHLVSMLLYECKSWFTKALKIIFAAAALYVMSACSRGGLMVAYIVILGYHFLGILRNELTKQVIFNIVKVTVVIAVAIFIITRIFPESTVIAANYINRLAEGINIYVGVSYFETDITDLQRSNVSNTVLPEYLNSSLKAIISEKGYGAKQLDVLYLQAFTDLGLIGGIYYLIVELFYPLKVLLVRREKSSMNLCRILVI